MTRITAVAALDIFSRLEDPGQIAKVIYPLDEIILIALCASLCGANAFLEFEEYGKAKLEFLRQFLPFKNGTPSHDAFMA